MSQAIHREVTTKAVGKPTSDGAGVRMTRVLGTEALDNFDPFLLLDEFRSDNPDDYIAGFPDHPHRGFETVTYMLAGHMKHADNQGNTGHLGPGSVQWMTAGRGIVHSEFPEQEDGLMWGFQLWVNLPAKDKMTAPRYQDIPADQIPEAEVGEGIRARVIAGSIASTSGPVTGPVKGVPTDPVYFDLSIGEDKKFGLTLPPEHNAFVYVYGGSVKLGNEGTFIQQGEIALLSQGQGLMFEALDDCRCILVAGKPLYEPIARYGPFVMNTEEEIYKAYEDYQAGRM